MWGASSATRRAFAIAFSATLLTTGSFVDARPAALSPPAAPYALCPSARDDVKADRVLSGYAHSNSFGDVLLGADVNWAYDPFGHPSWLTELNSVQWLNVSITRGTPADVSRVRSVLQDWVLDNPRNKPATQWAWIDRVSALRARTLLCAGRYFSSEQWWRDAIDVHGAFLAEDASYRYWNHGLDEDITLAMLGCTQGRENWFAKAKTRGAENIRRAVDREGADQQQSVGYAKYTLNQINQFVRAVTLCEPGYRLPGDRAARLRDFVAHATRPDGRFEQLGDTYQDIAPVSPAPAATVAVYRAGYVFGRSSWRPTASYYTLRFGVPTTFHGHGDHESLTYFREGREWLIDSGMIGYKIGAYHNWINRAPAHNVVIVQGAGKILNPSTRTSAYRLGAKSESYVLDDGPYRGLHRNRKVLHVGGRNEFFVVVDTLTDTRPVPDAQYQQLWHLPHDVTVRFASPNAVDVRSADGRRTFHIVQAWAGTTTVMHASIPPAPIQGWRSRSFEERLAAPTVVRTQRGASAWFVTLLVDTSPGRPVFAVFTRAGGRTVLRVAIGATRRDIVVDEQLLRGA